MKADLHLKESEEKIEAIGYENPQPWRKCIVYIWRNDWREEAPVREMALHLYSEELEKYKWNMKINYFCLWEYEERKPKLLWRERRRREKCDMKRKSCCVYMWCVNLLTLYSTVILMPTFYSLCVGWGQEEKCEGLCVLRENKWNTILSSFKCWCLFSVCINYKCCMQYLWEIPAETPRRETEKMKATADLRSYWLISGYDIFLWLTIPSEGVQRRGSIREIREREAHHFLHREVHAAIRMKLNIPFFSAATWPSYIPESDLI